MEGFEKIVDILKGYGAKKIVLFGSLARESGHRYSDIDVACEGLPQENFFKALGEILSVLDEDVDMLDLEEVKGTLRSRIEREGVLLYEAS